jgi:hypothetical protein
MTEIDLAAWVKGLDMGVAEVADVLNGSQRRAADLHSEVVYLADSLRHNPDPEVRAALRSAETDLAFLWHRLEEVSIEARRGAR